MQNVRFQRGFGTLVSPFIRTVSHSFLTSAVAVALACGVGAGLGCGGSTAGTPGGQNPSNPAGIGTSSATDTKIRAAVGGAERTPKEVARDVYRHPIETLEFFGLKDDMNVVELSPGQGWYTSILAPVLRDTGKLAIVGGDPNGDPKSEGTHFAKMLQDRFTKAPQVFDKVESRVVADKGPIVLGPAESADMVLTFRNYHNWVEDGSNEAMLAAILKVLKHGGVLGVTDHRANPGAPVDKKTVGDTGYLPEDFVIKTIEAAGFKLAAKSEINANPKDTKNYPKGVWTLPPVLDMGETDRAKYEAIGESDRMTLKFLKL